MKWFRKSLLPSLLALLIFAAAYSFYLYWTDSKQLQNVGTIATFGVTAVLVLVTWRYVHITEQTLDLYREQWVAQRAIHLRFGLKKSDGRARVWVRNLGIVPFMITKIVIQAPQSKPRSRNMHMLVHPVRMAEFFIPDDVWSPFISFCDIDITLFYESASQSEQSCSKAFNLELDPGKPKQVRLIRRGIRDWTVFCPKCRRNYERDFNYLTFHHQMNTHGLENFDQASKRAALMEDDYERTCPDHSSDWEASGEAQYKHHATQEVEDQ